MRTTMMMLVVSAGVLAVSAQANAVGQKHLKRPGKRAVRSPAGDRLRSEAKQVGSGLRPPRYQEGGMDLKSFPGTQLPPGPAGERYRLVRPHPDGDFLIERTRPGEDGLVRGYARLGFSGRTFQRRTFCTRGCGFGQIDPSVYRKVSLGDVGLDRYILWVPRDNRGPALIEQVVGVTNFADVSPLVL